MPKRERYLWVCTNERDRDNPKGSCARAGSREIHRALKAGLVTRGLHKRFRVCETGCLDLCWEGPSIAVEPDHVFYGNVTRADVDDILDALASDSLVSRLVVPEHRFDDPNRGEQSR